MSLLDTINNELGKNKNFLRNKKSAQNPDPPEEPSVNEEAPQNNSGVGLYLNLDANIPISEAIYMELQKIHQNYKGTDKDKHEELRRLFRTFLEKIIEVEDYYLFYETWICFGPTRLEGAEKHTEFYALLWWEWSQAIARSGKEATIKTEISEDAIKTFLTHYVANIREVIQMTKSLDVNEWQRLIGKQIAIMLDEDNTYKRHSLYTFIFLHNECFRGTVRNQGRDIIRQQLKELKKTYGCQNNFLLNPEKLDFYSSGELEKNMVKIICYSLTFFGHYESSFEFLDLLKKLAADIELPESQMDLEMLFRFWFEADEKKTMKKVYGNRLQIFYFQKDEETRDIELASSKGLDNWVFVIGEKHSGKTSFMFATEESLKKKENAFTICHTHAHRTSEIDTLRGKWNLNHDLSTQVSMDEFSSSESSIYAQTGMLNFNRLNFFDIQGEEFDSFESKNISYYFSHRKPVAIILVVGISDVKQEKYFNIIQHFKNYDLNKDTPIYIVFNKVDLYLDSLINSNDLNEKLYLDLRKTFFTQNPICYDENFINLKYHRSVDSYFKLKDFLVANESTPRNLPFFKKVSTDIDKIKNILDSLFEDGYNNMSFFYTSCLRRDDSGWSLSALWEKIRKESEEATIASRKKQFLHQFKDFVTKGFEEVDQFFKRAYLESRGGFSHKKIMAFENEIKHEDARTIFSIKSKKLKGNTVEKVRKLFSDYPVWQQLQEEVLESKHLNEKLFEEVDRCLVYVLEELGIPAREPIGNMMGFSELSLEEKERINNFHRDIGDNAFFHPQYGAYGTLCTYKDRPATEKEKSFLGNVIDRSMPFVDVLKDFSEKLATEEDRETEEGDAETSASEEKKEPEATETAQDEDKNEDKNKNEDKDENKKPDENTEDVNPLVEICLFFKNYIDIDELCRRLEVYRPPYPKYNGQFFFRRFDYDIYKKETLENVGIQLVKDRAEKNLVMLYEVLADSHRTMRKEAPNNEVFNIYKARFLINTVKKYGFRIEEETYDDFLERLQNAYNGINKLLAASKFSVKKIFKGKDLTDICEKLNNEMIKLHGNFDSIDPNRIKKRYLTKFLDDLKIAQVLIQGVVLLSVDEKDMKKISNYGFSYSENNINTYNVKLQEYYEDRKNSILLERAQYLETSGWLKGLSIEMCEFVRNVLSPADIIASYVDDKKTKRVDRLQKIFSDNLDRLYSKEVNWKRHDTPYVWKGYKDDHFEKHEKKVLDEKAGYAKKSELEVVAENDPVPEGPEHVENKNVDKAEVSSNPESDIQENKK